MLWKNVIKHFNRKLNNEITRLRERIDELELLEKKQKEVERKKEQLEGNIIC